MVRRRRGSGPRGVRGRRPWDVPDEPRRTRLHRARGGLRAAVRRSDRGGRDDADAIHGSRRAGADPRAGPRPGAHRPDGVRRRLRGQAGPLASADDRHRRVAARSPGPLRLSAPGIDGSTTKRHPARITAAVGADADGRLTAVDFDGDFDTGAYASWGRPSRTASRSMPRGRTSFPPCAPRRGRSTRTGRSAGAFRGFGVPQAAIATETLIDDVAEQLGIDRLDIRLRNALRAGSPTATGQILAASAGLRAVPRGAAPGVGRGRWPMPVARTRNGAPRRRHHAEASASRPCGTGSATRRSRTRRRSDRPPRRWIVRAVQRRAGHRPGLGHDPDPDRGRRARRAGRVDPARDRRHGSDAGRRQDRRRPARRSYRARNADEAARAPEWRPELAADRRRPARRPAASCHGCGRGILSGREPTTRGRRRSTPTGRACPTRRTGSARRSRSVEVEPSSARRWFPDRRGA